MFSVFYFNEMFCFGGFKRKYNKSPDFTTRGQKTLRNRGKQKTKNLCFGDSLILQFEISG